MKKLDRHHSLNILTNLKQKRKEEFKADISFDLDGDKVVSIRDYFIAKKFDKDGDGKLNAEEKTACMTALNNGYEKNFKFGLEAKAPVKG